MNEVTRILNAIDQGDSQAAEKLLPLVYEELRRLARAQMSQERTEHTLQATALVHEAYLRLVDTENAPWDGRGHFFAAAAEAMRRILIEHARHKQTLKRGGEQLRIQIDENFPLQRSRMRRILNSLRHRSTYCTTQMLLANCRLPSSAPTTRLRR